MAHTFLKQTLAAALAVMLISVCYTAVAQTNSMTINNGRAVAKAAEAIEDIYGVAITYEDPAYVHTSTLEAPGLLKDASTSFTYETAPPGTPFQERKAMAGAAIADAIQNYQGGQWFKTVEYANGFHVIPTQYVDTSGQTMPFTPYFDTLVTVQPQDPLWPLIKAARGVKILNGLHEEMILGEGGITGRTAVNQPVRAILEDVFVNNNRLDGIPIPGGNGSRQSVPAMFSWQLFCDPNTGFGCFMNVHLIAQKQPTQ